MICSFINNVLFYTSLSLLRRVPLINYPRAVAFFGSKNFFNPQNFINFRFGFPRTILFEWGVDFLGVRTFSKYFFGYSSGVNVSHVGIF